MMAKMTVGFGVLLILLGAIGFIGTGSAHPTALIPAYVGIIMAGCGVLAHTENTSKRMLWMHIAVTVGLLGFLAGAGRAIVVLVAAHGEPLAHPDAVEASIGMAILCGLFVGLCVRSFIAARRGRIAEA
jgi:hypothetical protein